MTASNAEPTNTVRPNRGFHPILETPPQHLFVDACIQAWPDADYANAHKHGATAYCVTAFHPQQTLEQSLEEIMYWHLIARKNPNLRVAVTAQDIRDAYAANGACFVLASQDGEFMWGKLHRLEAFWRLGMRVMIPAYNRNNLICGGCLDAGDVGLSRFGRLVVQESNRLGVLLDCSHVSRRASLEIIHQSSDPVIFSHSNPSALAENPRNIDNEQILACVQRGGVIGAVNWGPLAQKTAQNVRPTLSDFLDHIDYLCNLIGNAGHVGIGSDMSLGSYPDHTYDPWGHPDYPNTMAKYNQAVPIAFRSPLRYTEGFDSFSQISDVVSGLGARGYSNDQVAGILGGNFLRVFERVWKPMG
jgi:membrane dipeptidase